MKYRGLKLAVLALALSSVASKAGEVESLSLGKTVAERNCAWCHGYSGEGFATAPLLAGQWDRYLQNQLSSFQAHTLDSPFARKYMWGVTEKLDPQTTRALAAYYSTLSAPASRDGDKELAVSGEQIYRDGIPGSNVPSCVPCHGLKAEGLAEIPRLGGQSFNYLKRKLDHWAQGYDAATAPPMPEIATKLSPKEIEALASYLSFK